jgi:hypothetical protein
LSVLSKENLAKPVLQNGLQTAILPENFCNIEQYTHSYVRHMHQGVGNFQLGISRKGNGPGVELVDIAAGGAGRA